MIIVATESEFLEQHRAMLDMSDSEVVVIQRNDGALFVLNKMEGTTDCNELLGD